MIEEEENPTVKEVGDMHQDVDLWIKSKTEEELLEYCDTWDTGEKLEEFVAQFIPEDDPARLKLNFFYDYLDLTQEYIKISCVRISKIGDLKREKIKKTLKLLKEKDFFRGLYE